MLGRVILTLLLAAVLVPTLSRAVTRVRGDAAPWNQGCVAVAPSSSGALNPTPADTEAWHHLLEHCPLCALDRELPDGLPQGPLSLPLLTLAEAPAADWPGQFDREPRARWHHRPRAPPVVS